jgi:TetR/AcrR family transcriptional regulator, transcriptional repressor for nem operon
MDMSNLRTTSDEILASARSFIVMGGYNAFSYADIAEVVGIRKASIHHHFPSKVDLVRTLLMRYRESAETGLGQLQAQTPDPVELLQAYAGMWSRCIEDASIPFCVCALLAAELPALPPAVATEVRAYFRFLSSWLAAIMERGAQQGLLRIEGSAQLEAETFMATVHGAMLSARAQGMPFLFGAVLTPVLRRLAAA